MDPAVTSSVGCADTSSIKEEEGVWFGTGRNCGRHPLP